MSKEILITGATGCVGQALVRALSKIKSVSKCYLVVRDITLARDMFANDEVADFSIEYIDSNNLQEIQNKCQGVSVVVHLASFISSADDRATLEKLVDANIVFSSLLLDAIKDLKIKLFINTGTFAEYAGKDNQKESAYLYAATKTAYKALIEYYSKRWKFKWVDVIPYTIYGGQDKAKKIFDLLLGAMHGESVDLTNGEQVLDFIHVNDIVSFYMKLILEHESYKFDCGQVFQLGTGTGCSIRELAHKIELESGQMLNINWGAKEYRPNDIMYAVANTQNLKKLLHWESVVDLKQGIQLLLSKDKKMTDNENR